MRTPHWFLLLALLLLAPLHAEPVQPLDAGLERAHRNGKTNPGTL
jgi:hypothetical protein